MGASVLRQATAMVTAAAVLWHTLVGCCAHHAHVEPLGSPQPGLAVEHSVGVPLPHANAHACSSCSCRHQAKASRGGGRTAVIYVRKQTNPDKCPGDAPQHCCEPNCVFAAPDSLGSLLLAVTAFASVFLDDAQCQHTALACRQGSARPVDGSCGVDGALRRHLTFGVLLL